MSDMTIGQFMREQRTFIGISQVTLAERAGLSPSTIKRYESDENKPDFEAAYRIFDALDLTLDDVTEALYGN